VDSDRPDAFTDTDQTVLTALARQAELVIRNTWLFEQARLKARLLASLVSTARQMNTALGLDDLLRLVTREASGLLRARLASVLMLDAAEAALEVRAHHGAEEGMLGRTRLALEESLFASVIRRRRPLQVEDVRASSLYLSTEVARREGIASLLSVPLSSGGRGRGVLNVYTAEPHSFSNEEIGTLSALADLTVIAIERAELFERTSAAEEQLRQNERLGALGLLAAEVAHEIRNPLTVMKLLYHSLDLQFPPGDPRAEDARLMGVKMDHLNRIVEQVLDFARSSEPRREAVAVADVIENLRLLVRHKLRQQGIALELRLPPALPPVRADAVQFEQACLNLVLNAAEAMPAGGRLAIRARALPGAGGRVRLTFHDAGAGMTREQARRAFTGILGTTKPKGTGLGLALVRRFVEVHQGAVRLRSRPGRGTSIALTLPAAEGVVADAAASASPR
jgi:signal transduction histidine kinase